MTYEDYRIRTLLDDNPAAVELAETVSFAVLIEPQLLRAARRELVPHADAGAEADVWLSSMVEARAADGIVLDRNVAQMLRRNMRERLPDRFDRAWNLVRSMHAHVSPAIQLEEEINYALTEVDAESKERVGQLLAKATATLVADPQRRGLANWAARVLPKLPPEIRQSDAARVLAAASYVRLAKFMPAWTDESGGSVTQSLGWLLPPELGDLPLRVRFVAKGVEINTSVRTTDPVLRVPATEPMLIEVSWETNGRREVERVEIFPGERRLVETRASMVHVQTITGQRFSLTQEKAKERKKPDMPICFVVMGFGKKTDFQTGRVLDLDKSYRYIIKPGVEAAGLQCIRADEIRHSGSIDEPTYQYLLNADVVIADLSTYNPNAFYELGVRHALRPYTTIAIAESEFKYPFDTSHIAIRSYRHLGDGIDFDEVERMRGEITGALTALIEKTSIDSPVYTFLKNLHPPSVGTAAAEMAAAQETSGGQPSPETPTFKTLDDQAEAAMARSDFITAKSLLAVMRSMAPGNTGVVQRLALATYKAKTPTAETALVEARELIETLQPQTTLDVETLGLWAAIHRRLWEIRQQPALLDVTVLAFERAFFLKQDYYSGINLAFLLDLRASMSPLAEGIADSVLARRTRRRIIEVCNDALQATTRNADRYWILATMAEAELGLGEGERSADLLERSKEIKPESWMVTSTEDQLAKLKEVLSHSPLLRLPSTATGTQS